ncbi:MAG: DUF4197 family protein, partial [Novosphingobium sp.]|nr:DUF4197 family protein [Novosphingobium sp.]
MRWRQVELGISIAANQLYKKLEARRLPQPVRAALAAGAKAAVLQLGQAGGFSGNPKVRIGLPGVLDDAA